ncbi:cytochrome c peroxidase [uncultured Chitinophaga sp.]|jgi:Cytochrome c peroxidase|uniref:cytochrome-c peroxidase n=1 Tax=uncultured Chitinophaga sp. TaxID=339340 RepID=UPI0026167D73|nr:cytochrome c peroxidase [uncultured Chitinophaga sp.]
MKQFLIIGIAAVLVLLVPMSFKDREPADIAELGALLFFDPILSADCSISCSSCHQPDHAFADTGMVSKGVGGKKGVRNTPSAMNVRLQSTFFWDGRAASLEEQALAPIANPDEMNLPVPQALERLQRHPAYRHYFKKFFDRDPDSSSLAAALAAYERTLETSDSPFDNWKFSDNPAAVSDAVKRGFDVFNGKGRCVECHFGADFTQRDFRNIGLFNGSTLNDSGRAAITKRPEDLGKFKIGSLRNVALTSPYMHNGMFRTLEEVIEFYNDPARFVPDAINRDSLLAKPMGLSTDEKKDLLAFLHSLTDKQFNKQGE